MRGRSEDEEGESSYSASELFFSFPLEKQGFSTAGNASFSFSFSFSFTFHFNPLFICFTSVHSFVLLQFTSVLLYFTAVDMYRSLI
jgi:hypothetical protein